jgi:uncharacterized protein
VRVFLDTNVLVAAIATRGLCTEILEGVLQTHELLICDPVLSELERVLVSKLRLPAPRAADFVTLLRDEGQFVQVRKKPSVRIRDADDVPILSCALGGRAELFVTGDKALLDLHEVDGLPILSPREFWTQLAGGSLNNAS